METSALCAFSLAQTHQRPLLKSLLDCSAKRNVPEPVSHDSGGGMLCPIRDCMTTLEQIEWQEVVTKDMQRPLGENVVKDLTDTHHLLYLTLPPAPTLALQKWNPSALNEKCRARDCLGWSPRCFPLPFSSRSPPPPPHHSEPGVSKYQRY